jgi:hypothetical protein
MKMSVNLAACDESHNICKRANTSRAKNANSQVTMMRKEHWMLHAFSLSRNSINPQNIGQEFFTIEIRCLKSARLSDPFTVGPSIRAGW